MDGQAQQELDQLRHAHEALLRRYAFLESSHSELKGLYDQAVAEKECSATENQKLWQRFKSSPKKKSRQNSAGSSTSIPVQRTGTPPNLHAPPATLSHSPLSTTTARLSPPADETPTEVQYLDEVEPVSPFFTAPADPATPATLEESSPTKSPFNSQRRSLTSTASLLPALPPTVDDAISSTPTQDPPPRPVLTPAFLPFVRLRVGSTSMRTSERDRGKASVYLIEVTVDIASDPEREGGLANWSISKSYRDLAGLDGFVRKLSKVELKQANSFPDKATFKDQTKKKLVQAYLQSLLPIQGCGIKLCEFLNSDVVLAGGSTESGAGWLTKRGKNLGMWHSRYYSLSESRESLLYFDSVGGAKLGEIKLANAEIGKQKTATAEYQHSFLIRTTADDGDTDTILCASSDASRDDWIRALTRKATSAEAMTKSSRRKSLPQPLESLGLTEPVPPRQRLTRPKPTGSDSPLSSSPSIPDHDSLPSSTPQSASLPLPEFASLPLHELPDSSRSTSRFVVSGPTNASPLPPGYDFKSDSRSREQQEKDRKGKTKSSFWGFNRNTPVVAPPTPPPVPSSNCCFGVPLRDAVLASPLSPDLHLPAVVYRCLEFLSENDAVSEEGIFRLSGSSNVIRSLKDRFDFEGDVDLIRSATFYDIHAIAGLLKTYLRDLPSQQLLTRELSHLFISEILEMDVEDRPEALRQRLSLLPIENLTLITHLFKHLALIAENADVNKMSIRNLAIVLSPSLAIPAPLFTLLIAEFSNNPPAPSSSPALPPLELAHERSLVTPEPVSKGADAESTFSLRLDGDGGAKEEIEGELVSPPPRSPGLSASPRISASPLA